MPLPQNGVYNEGSLLKKSDNIKVGTFSAWEGITPHGQTMLKRAFSPWGGSNALF